MSSVFAVRRRGHTEVPIVTARSTLWGAIISEVVDVPDRLQDPAAVRTRDMDNAD
jgi:hypothetical protein